MTKQELIAGTQRVKNAQRVAAEALDDATALEAIALYPIFEDLVAENATVKQGFRFQYNNKLYRVAQPSHTFTEVYVPSIDTTALFVEVTVESAGNDDDAPIEYNGGMDLLVGKYYIQDNVVYVCTRELLNAVHPLSALVGLYVELA